MTNEAMYKVSDEETKEVIADFLEMGYVDNIIAMFKADTSYYDWSGDILNDERFMVRMGMVVLFDEMVKIRPNEVSRAIPALAPYLKDAPSYVRGEAATILGLIGTDEALQHIRPLVNDPDPQVAEIVKDIFEGGEE